ncbi:MAG: hypothetical protein OEZ10_08640 [Gammaproteobacteria bacterium]|nr:hypothetical protein [Gammaproteobacteria bacterium]
MGLKIMSETPRPGAFERHVQTIAVTMIAGLLYWVGESINDAGKEIILLKERVAVLSEKLAEVSTMSSSIVAMQRRVDEIDFRLKVVEGRPRKASPWINKRTEGGEE